MARTTPTSASTTVGKPGGWGAAGTAAVGEGGASDPPVVSSSITSGAALIDAPASDAEKPPAADAVDWSSSIDIDMSALLSSIASNASVLRERSAAAAAASLAGDGRRARERLRTGDLSMLCAEVEKDGSWPWGA